MTKTEHQQHRQQILDLVYLLTKARAKRPSYRSATAYLNTQEIRTARGNQWTEKRLFRFLQNAGISGLWGLSKYRKAPTMPIYK